MGVMHLENFSADVATEAINEKFQMFAGQVAFAIEQHVLHFTKIQRWKHLRHSMHTIHQWLKQNPLDPEAEDPATYRQLFSTIQRAVEMVIPCDFILFYLVDFEDKVLWPFLYLIVHRFNSPRC